MLTSIEEIIDALPLKQDGIVLDIGVGIGDTVSRVAIKVPHGNVLSIDLRNKNKKQSVHNIKNISCDVDKGNRLPFKDSFCDSVILFHTLRHVIYRESFLKECKRVLKPGGLIIVVESQMDSFGVDVHPDTRIIMDDMLEYLDRAGFLLGENFDTLRHEYGIMGICPLHNIADE